jgi:hypothetical protein
MCPDHHEQPRAALTLSRRAPPSDDEHQRNQRERKARQPLELTGLRGIEAAGIEPAPGGAKPLAESHPYLVTARNA